MENTKDPVDGIRNRVLRSAATSLSPGNKIKIGPKIDSPKHEINVVRNEQGVESIEVVCKCGERIVIRCEYV